MNFFFGIKHKFFKCEIQIPQFNNKGLINEKLKLSKRYGHISPENFSFVHNPTNQSLEFDDD